MKPIEIEVGSQRNDSLFFRPLGRRIRGRFDMARCNEPQAKVKAAEWPMEIPGQRLSVDPDGGCSLIEPLHEPEHAATKEKIEQAGYKLPKAMEQFGAADTMSWLFWMKRAVDNGLARIVSGSFDKIDQSKVVMDYVLPPKKSREDRLIEALERQTRALEALAAK